MKTFLYSLACWLLTFAVIVIAISMLTAGCAACGHPYPAVIDGPRLNNSGELVRHWSMTTKPDWIGGESYLVYRDTIRWKLKQAQNQHRLSKRLTEIAKIKASGIKKALPAYYGRRVTIVMRRDSGIRDPVSRYFVTLFANSQLRRELLIDIGIAKVRGSAGTFIVVLGRRHSFVPPGTPPPQGCHFDNIGSSHLDKLGDLFESIF